MHSCFYPAQMFTNLPFYASWEIRSGTIVVMLLRSLQLGDNTAKQQREEGSGTEQIL